MREAIFSRVRIAGWLTLFFAPVVMLEVGRELHVLWNDDDNHHYSEPTPEFTAAMRASQAASADR